MGTSLAVRARRGGSAFALAAVLLLGAACGGDDSDDDSATTTAASSTAAPGTDEPGADEPSTTTADGDDPGAGTDPAGGGTTAAPDTSAPDGPAPVRGGEITVGMIFDPFGLEPATFVGSVTDAHVSYALYDPLMTYLPEGGVEPWLLESIDSDDQQTWTLTLREGITFQDGTPLDAEAVKVNLERHKDPEVGSRALNNAREMDTITVVDPLTVEITLVTPRAAFPELLAGNMGLMASPTAIAAGTINTEPVGTGPFKLVDRVVGDRLTLERNEAYWREGEPYLDRITYRVILDDSVRSASVESGEIDVGQSILGNELAEAAATDGIGSTQTPPHANTIHLNTQTGPTADVEVRRALAMAIDYEALDDIIFEGTSPADQHLIGQQNPFYDDSIEFIGYDPEGAQALVAEWEAEHGDLRIPLRCYNGPDKLQMTQLVAQMWTAAGVDVDVQMSDQITLVIEMLGGDFSVGCLALGSATNDPDLVFYNQLQSESTSNYQKYSDPEMDAALETGRTSADPAVRQEAYSKVQELLARDVPLIEWSKSPWGFVYGDHVHGLVALPGSEFHPSQVWVTS